MSALEQRDPREPAIPATGPGRELGQKRKPQLRLALGYRDDDRRGAPTKTDYFIPHGSDAAVAKFKSVYGDKPRAVDIRLPSSLPHFLDIRHVAFAGGQNDGGGILKAIGHTNFAETGTLGGQDTLTVFSVVETGEVDRNNKPIPQMHSEEVYIDDVNDVEAQSLGVYLQMTVRFGIPDVLGFGGVCEIHSRGKETIDTLWLHAVDIYGSLGARASMLLRPKLVLKESSMLTPRGNKAPVYVVDLYVPESMDEILERAREFGAALGTPRDALYGRPALTASPALPSPAEEEKPSPPSTGSAGHAASADPPSDEDIEWPDEPEPSPETDRLVATAADAAGEFVIEWGQKRRGQTVAQVASEGANGVDWIRFTLGLAEKKPSSAPPPALASALLTYCRVHLPAVWQEAEAVRDLS